MHPLEILVDNIVQAAALHRAWSLGRASCSCDVLPEGNEWTPGMGVSPEQIVDRHWNYDEHPFVGEGERCLACNRHRQAGLHKKSEGERER